MIKRRIKKKQPVLVISFIIQIPPIDLPIQSIMYAIICNALIYERMKKILLTYNRYIITILLL